MPKLRRTLDGVVSYQAWVIEALAADVISKEKASGLTYGLQNMRGALEKRDLERQVHQLQVDVKRLKRGRVA